MSFARDPTHTRLSVKILVSRSLEASLSSLRAEHFDLYRDTCSSRTPIPRASLLRGHECGQESRDESASRSGSAGVLRIAEE